jgi:preprotein translocase subunit SecA
VDSHLSPGLPIEEWNMPALVAAIDVLGLAGPETTEEALWDRHNRDAIAMLLKDLAAERLEQKDTENSADWALIERLVLLRTIDSIWIEHLTEVDELRQGISLRGFAQEEPLNAFKKEAYGLYQEMQQLIRHQVATTIFRVSIVRQPPQPPAEGIEAATGEAGAGGAGSAGDLPKFAGRPLPKALPAGQPSGGATTTAGVGGNKSQGGEVRPGYSPAGVRMGRNDTCWCGSGRKYKKCHGS